jgi:hypothetical protein
MFCFKIINKKNNYFINNRKNNYNKIIKNIIDNNFNKYFIIQFYKYDIIPIYKVGNIIFNNRIGSNSNNAIIYNCYFKDKQKNRYNFTMKFCNSYNINEMNTIQILTNAVLNDKCPHFPINYYILNSNDKSCKYLFPNYNKDHNIYIFFNELADGDLNHFIYENNNYNNSVIMENALAQIFFSLIFFYKEINCFHNDAHWGNFLYHKIKSGGYFHYKIFNEDYYIENLGYLWIIWDFDFITPFNTEYSLIDCDFSRIFNAFFDKYNLNKIGWFNLKYNDDFTNKINNIYIYLFVNYLIGVPPDFKYDVISFNNFIKHILYILTHYNIIKTRIHKDDLVLNKDPYIITPFT